MVNIQPTEADRVADPHGRRTLSAAWWVAAAVIMAATTGAAMGREVTAAGAARNLGAGVDFVGMDFASTTWHAVRGLLAGQDVYITSTRIAGVGVTWPAGEHVPATLAWQAPFAALPFWAGFFAFDIASIGAIWAAVLLLTRPRSPQALMVAMGCGAFALLAGAGEWTLNMGQPTGFELLGVAMLVSARRPWIAALGFLLAASTFQTGMPLALALIVLGAWPVVWRGVVLVAALSLPAIASGVSAASGPVRYVREFTLGAFGHLGTLRGQPRQLAYQPNRIDLGALLRHAGIASTGIQIGAGLLVLALCLLLLARLPADLRRLDYPPIICLVLAVTVLCAYHQPYDMLLVVGAVIPVVLLVGERTAPMLGMFALTGVSDGVEASVPLTTFLDPMCLLAVAVLGALAARRGAKRRVIAASGAGPRYIGAIGT